MGVFDENIVDVLKEDLSSKKYSIKGDATKLSQVPPHDKTVFEWMGNEGQKEFLSDEDKHGAVSDDEPYHQQQAQTDAAEDMGLRSDAKPAEVVGAVVGDGEDAITA